MLRKRRRALASSRHSSDSMDERVTAAALLQRRRNQRSSIGIDGADGETSLTPLEPPVSPSVDPAGTGLVVVAKADTKQKKRAKRTDPAQFKRFIEAARKRGVDESLEDFAAKFFSKSGRRKGGLN